MRKLVTIFAALVMAVALFSCKGSEQQMTSTEVGNSLTEKLGRYVMLTEEQKIKIVEMSEASGIMAEGVRNSEDEAKLQELRTRIYNEVLTPEQRTKLDQSKVN